MGGRGTSLDYSKGFVFVYVWVGGRGLDIIIVRGSSLCICGREGLDLIIVNYSKRGSSL